MNTVILVAGGTAGHINPAITIGDFLNSKIIRTRYISGTRDIDHKVLNDYDSYHLPARPLVSRSIFKLIINILLNFVVFIQSFRILIFNRPSLIIGTGGFVCGPVLLAGKILRIPIVLHESNSVMGITNKILSKIANKILTNYKNTIGLNRDYSDKSFVVGNPLRSKIKFSENKIKEKINILIFGGSLGASQINIAVKKLLETYDGPEINIKHQVGLGNEFSVEKNNKVYYEQIEYLDNIDSDYSWSNIIISRAGSFTISELRIVARPSILIPYPDHLDDHQVYNSKNLMEEDLFYVKIMDKKLRETDLANAISYEIKKIINENKFYQNREIDSSESIHEIYNHIKDYA